MRVLLPYWKKRQQCLDGEAPVVDEEGVVEIVAGSVEGLVAPLQRLDNAGEEQGNEERNNNNNKSIEDESLEEEDEEEESASEGEEDFEAESSLDEEESEENSRPCDEHSGEDKRGGGAAEEQQARTAEPNGSRAPKGRKAESAVASKASPSKGTSSTLKRPALPCGLVRPEEPSPDRSKKRPRVEEEHSPRKADKTGPTSKTQQRHESETQEEKPAKLSTKNMTGGGRPRNEQDDDPECDYAANRFLLYTLNNSSSITRGTETASSVDDDENLQREPAQPLENEPPALENHPTFFNVPVAHAEASMPEGKSPEAARFPPTGGRKAVPPEELSGKAGRYVEKGREKRSASHESFQSALKQRGLEIVEQDGDGNCLFRAVSLQVYGDSSMHGEVRERCLDYMARDEAHYSQFVTGEPFRDYIARKRQDGVHGNNPEIQAISELFNRPVEVFTPDNGGTPLNIFHAEYKTGDTPIRLSYHDGNHYNAVVDPLKPTAGLGLGLPGLQPGLADKMQVAKAVAESDQLADEMDLKRALQESQQDLLQRVIKESSYANDYMYKSKVMALSDLDATNFELEQAALEGSMESYSRQEQGRKKRAAPRRGRRTSPLTTLPASNASTSSTSHAAAAQLPIFGDSMSSAAAVPAAASAPTSSVASLPPEAASLSDLETATGVASRKSPRSSSRHHRNASNDTAADAGVASVAAAAAAASPKDDAGIPPVVMAGMGSADEYPQTIQELVMNGFELSKVVHAYELIGDNFDDLLAFLISTSTGPSSASNTTAASSSAFR